MMLLIPARFAQRLADNMVRWCAGLADRAMTGIVASNVPVSEGVTKSWYSRFYLRALSYLTCATRPFSHVATTFSDTQPAVLRVPVSTAYDVSRARARLCQAAPRPMKGTWHVR